ncbi:MAG: ParB/RepB/Spo0J family partition protein [Reyranella sp.]|uniref:ParB/RepB/Spo0J family partition protein n=1 Tax=Reyranella sp. TaxID=1929291 RepID=UPI00120E2C34|nr:ParB/RepB/Spo0J family partition protein [Reyranella sp.]TAJ86451.1 MAG: ParB/RepB/Spo0J family partition protein [Reyranella sp.]TBR28631.1 MAG: ParB/RepB/Spo0J family partition protein [Reyranella sp.]
MSQAPKPRGLGRGLSALLGDDEVASAVAPAAPAVAPPPSVPAPAAAQAAPAEAEPARPSPGKLPPLTLPIGQLKPGKMQPRTSFEGIEMLVESVKEYGLLQPILVRPLRDAADSYEIIAGERRWRAAQRAQLHDVPVVIRTIDDQDALQIGLVENLQRSDLTPIDEAQGYKRLIEDYSHTQEEIARMMGRSRPHVANTIRLLDLPPPVQEMVREGELSAGQARTLIGVPDPLAMAKRAVSEKLTVRDLERLAGDTKKPSKAAGGARVKGGAGSGGTPKSADTRALEKRLEEALGLKVDLTLRGLGEQSVLTLEIRDFDQLDTVVDKLTRR